MADLKELIAENQALLDDIEPIHGHFKRFSKKLERRENVRKILMPLLAAASIATIITIILINIKISYKNDISLGDISKEYQEAELYYQKVFMAEQNKFLRNVEQNSTLKKNVEKELDQMENMFEQLIIDFRTNPFDVRMISAIIIHYQTKIDFIKKINAQLENNTVRTVKNFNYEDDRI